METHGDTTGNARVPLLCFIGGAAALSWEVLWQHYTSLALGISALGTAITLAVTMAGMASGSIVGARVLRERVVSRPLRLYGFLEAFIGLIGLTLAPAFGAIEQLDAAVFRATPALAPAVHLVAMVVVLGPASVAMGATIPVLGLVARQHGLRLSTLYAFNTTGAAAGTLAIAFVLIPILGITSTSHVVAALNLVICLVAVAMTSAASTPSRDPGGDDARGPARELPLRHLVAFTTGFVTFALEVAWFRSLRAAFESRTDSFAIILVSVLVPIALGAALARVVRRRDVPLALICTLAAVAVLLATPIIERFHILAFEVFPSRYVMRIAAWQVLSLIVLGPSMLLLAVPLPVLLDDARTPRQWGRLYAANTAGAVTGSLVAAWALLPTFGFARTSWGVALLVGVLALLVTEGTRRRTATALAVMCGLVVAVSSEAGLGRERVQGRAFQDEVKVLAYRENPDATISVIEAGDTPRQLVIDGFTASGEAESARYMEWMGRLPMLLHPAPRRALVICFGTGQTAHAVRDEGVESLDIVDLNASVFELAPLFEKNHGVLDDPRVHTMVMDGRAYLRRTDTRYDVVTLEPMPPNFAGVNSLYLHEFYLDVAARLHDGGVVAQWLPFHLVAPDDALAITATFTEVFQDALMWVDPQYGTGVLVGRRASGGAPLVADWPGFERIHVARGLDAEVARAGVALAGSALARYAELGERITDDNQLLSYGWARFAQEDLGAATGPANQLLIRRVREGPLPSSSSP